MTALAASAALLSPPAAAMEPGEKGPLFYLLRAELDGTKADGEGLFTWDMSGWVGRDRDKLWLRSEGEVRGGHLDEAEIWGLYSRNIAAFWDAQVGVRQDFEPRGTTYAVVGVSGLSRYFFETDVHLFVSHRGDVSARLEQTFDLLITQRLIAELHLELNLSAQDVPELGLGAGLNAIETGVQLRDEILRKFAPYLDFTYVRATGETAGLRRAAGESVDEFTVRAGVRFWV